MELNNERKTMKVKTTKAQDLEVGQTYAIRSLVGPTEEVYITEELETILFTDGNYYVHVIGITAPHGFEFQRHLEWDTECEDC